MTNDELAARIIVLEALVVAALGGVIRFGRAPVPTEHVIAILNEVKGVVRARMADPGEQVSPAGEQEAHRYLDEILSRFSETVIPRKPDQGP